MFFFVIEEVWEIKLRYFLFNVKYLEFYEIEWEINIYKISCNKIFKVGYFV